MQKKDANERKKERKKALKESFERCQPQHNPNKIVYMYSICIYITNKSKKERYKRKMQTKDAKIRKKEKKKALKESFEKKLSKM